MTQSVKVEGAARRAANPSVNAGLRRAWHKDFDVSLTRRTALLGTAAGLVLYAGLWLLPWQGLVPLPALRVVVAFLLWLLPGWVVQQLVWDGKGLTASQRLAVSFGLACTVAASAGLVATALGLALPFVIGVLVGVTGVGCIALAARGEWTGTHKFRLEITPPTLWMLLPVAATCLLVMRLTAIQGAITDNLTYAAYLANWQFADKFDWNEIFLGLGQTAPTRFWLAFWTLSEALVAHASGIHGFELVQFYFSPLLGLCGLLATYPLARAFDLSRAVSCFAVTAHAAALLLLVSNDQPGVYFYNRLVEDKVLAAFVLLPVFAIAATGYLKQPGFGRGFLVLGTGAGLVFTHPTMSGTAAALVGLFALLDGLARRQWRATLGLVLLLGVIVVVPLALRWLDPQLSTRIVFGVDADLQRDGQLRRLLQWNDFLVGVNPLIVAAVPSAWLWAAAGVALTRLRTSFAARWIVVSALLLASVIFPITATAWSMAIPASQLYRVVWMIPFGLAAAYLAVRVWEWLAARAQWPSAAGSSLVLPALALLLLGASFGSVQSGTQWKNLHGLKPPRVAPDAYENLLALQPVLAERLTSPTIIVGGDRWLNERVPGMTANARVFVFRSVRNMWELGNQTRAEAHARNKAWHTLIHADTPTRERLAVLSAYNVRYVMANADTRWVKQILKDAPDPLALVTEKGTLRLYELTQRMH